MATKKYVVTGDQYRKIDRKMWEIKRQLNQKGGSPLNPEKVAEALQNLQTIIEGEKLNLEAGFPLDVSNELRRLGHEILIVPKIAGGMNGIIVNQKNGMLHGGACWRADGVPMGQSGGPAHKDAMMP